ncbi:S-adenosyl-L-methionine-dependent methyltransferase [Hypoxylon sp. FL0890]|nr:S-adenosyl-L-methionine-dependent methyltransferase [Hypoxylon sp. FL0890]
MEEATVDQWKLAAETYEKSSKTATTKPTDILLERLNIRFPFAQASGILDDGCGPGSCMSRLIKTYGQDISPSCTLICSDWAPSMIQQVNNAKDQSLGLLPDSAWSRVDARVLDAMDLNSVADESLSHVMAGWVFHMTHNPQKCLSEARRVLKSGGVLGVASWKETQWLDAMKPIKKLKPELSPPTGSGQFASPSGLSLELKRAGFSKVELQEIDVELPFESHALFIDMLLTRMPPLVAIMKGFSTQQKEDLRYLMTNEIQKLCPQEPGFLKGIALVAISTR